MKLSFARSYVIRSCVTSFLETRLNIFISFILSFLSSAYVSPLCDIEYEESVLSFMLYETTLHLLMFNSNSHVSLQFLNLSMAQFSRHTCPTCPYKIGDIEVI